MVVAIVSTLGDGGGSGGVVGEAVQGVVAVRHVSNAHDAGRWGWGWVGVGGGDVMYVKHVCVCVAGFVGLYLCCTHTCCTSTPLHYSLHITHTLSPHVQYHDHYTYISHYTHCPFPTQKLHPLLQAATPQQQPAC